MEQCGSRKVDVAILGGGLAGNLVARQLRMQRPELSIVVFERDTERGFKVGESTVEIAANYFIRRQKLSRYMYMRQLPKNSLRFFFDSKERDADLSELSEIGSDRLAPLPSFQLDRQRLEIDLIEMNAKAEIEVQVGAAVKSVRLAETDAAGRAIGEHQIDVDYQDTQTTWSARWVVDCSGRAQILSKLMDLKAPVPEHKIVSSWARGANVADIDAFHPSEEWRAKARYTTRTLSTNHFCYPGYWLWFIPLSSDLISLGIVQARDQWKPAQATREGFLAFMREHRACAQMLENAELVDIGTYAQLAYRTKRFWDGPARWAMVGESAAFTDPFYSPGSDFIAIESDMVVDMIDRELKGEDIAERSRLYDEFVAWRFEVTLLLYADLYKTFGSYELFREKCYFDCAAYYNLWVDGYMKDEHLDTKALKYNLRRKGYVLEAMRNFNRLFAGAADEMMAKGTYWRGNLGNDVLNGVHAFGVFEGLGKPRSHRDINERTEMIFNEARRGVMRMLDDESVEPYRRGAAPPRDVAPGVVSRGDLLLEDFMGDVDLRHAQSSRDMAPPAAE